LTAVMEDMVERCVMVELDRDVAAFWHAALHDGSGLDERVLHFAPTGEALRELMERPAANVVEHGFRTLVLNRTRRGGVLAPGASLLKAGENGKGLASRWYPETIANRLREIAGYAHRINFYEGNGMAMLAALGREIGEGVVVFVDPPYTSAGGKRPGKRLYAHNEIDHPRLFKLLREGKADFLMTYDPSDEILDLVGKHSFHAVQVTMKNSHHARIPELVITNRPVFGS